MEINTTQLFGLLQKTIFKMHIMHKYTAPLLTPQIILLITKLK
jgi:hypothetical protein